MRKAGKFALGAVGVIAIVTLYGIMGIHRFVGVDFGRMGLGPLDDEQTGDFV